MRVPLPVKLLLTFLLVAAALFVPTAYLVRVVQPRTWRELARQELEAEVQRLTDQLAPTTPETLDRTAAEILKLADHRVTIIDMSGRVVADSLGSGVPYENHAERPEVKAALLSPAGLGTAERLSVTAGEKLMYVAARFPLMGDPRGVVRVAMPTAPFQEADERAFNFLERAGALALSVALILTVLSVVVISRPLRRIADAARAYGAGDLGHVLVINSNDELKEVADAMSDLSTRLRARLLTSGVDRATLNALLDDLPVGVVLFDSEGEPLTINGRAREQLALTPRHEVGRARQLVAMESQAPIVARVLTDGIAAETTIKAPWLDGAVFKARWAALYAPDGSRQPALLTFDPTEAPSAQRTTAALVDCVDALRSVRTWMSSQANGPLSLLTRLDVALQVAAAASEHGVAPGDLEVVRLSDVCSRAFAELGGQFAAGEARLEVVANGDVSVIEAGGRVQHAVTALFGAGRLGASPQQTVRIIGEESGSKVRLRVRTSGVPAGWSSLARTLRPLGGDAEIKLDGDFTEAMIALPRA